MSNHIDDEVVFSYSKGSLLFALVESLAPRGNLWWQNVVAHIVHPYSTESTNALFRLVDWPQINTTITTDLSLTPHSSTAYVF